MTLFKIFMMFGDALDRIIFLLEIIQKKDYDKLL